MKVRSLSFWLVAIATLVLTAQMAHAQTVAKKERIRSPATVRSTIGGEAQHQYVIRARKGQRMTVQISWRKQDNNFASFSVSPASGSPDAFTGTESDGGKRWTATIPKTRDYIISVVANPLADYTLRVRLK